MVAAVWLAVPAVRRPGRGAGAARLGARRPGRQRRDARRGARAGAAVLSINRTSGAAPPGRALELWAIEGTNPPVSLGVLPDAPLARVALPPDLAARLGPGAILAVTEEAAGRLADRRADRRAGGGGSPQRRLTRPQRVNRA